MKSLKIILLSCFISVFFSLCNLYASTETKRTISKSFKAKANDELRIDNNFGNIVISEWNKSEILISVEIIGKAKDKNTSEVMADRVSIDFNQSGKKISAKTNIKNSQCNDCGVTVNYIVNIPAFILMDLTNKFGNINLPDVQHNFNANIRFGNLNGNNLSGKNNKINIEYGNIEFNYVTALNLDISFGKAKVKKADYLEMNSKYSGFEFSEIEYLKLDSQFDKFTIGTIENIHASAAYTDFTISELTKNFEIADIKFGKLQVKKVSDNFHAIKISASYTKIRINLTNEHKFKADLKNSFGKIKTNNITFNNVSFKEKDDDFSQTIKGTAGKNADPKATVKISNQHADIIFGL